jgi:uncharacterized membrane protein YgdD (TMEM256/DUF423 family)
MKALRTFAALSAALAIAAGAFGAHAAKPPAVEWLRTGAMYQLIHAVAVIAMPDRLGSQCWLLLIGAAIFAGSLYAMALGAPRVMGAVTPVGGLAMIAGWLWIALRTR